MRWRSCKHLDTKLSRRLSCTSFAGGTGMVSMGPIVLGDSTSDGGVSGGAKAGEGGGMSRREFDLRREPRELRVNGGRTLVEDARWRLGGGAREAIRPARRARGLMKTQRGWQRSFHTRPTSAPAALSALFSRHSRLVSPFVGSGPHDESSACTALPTAPGPAPSSQRPPRQTGQALFVSLRGDCSSPVALPPSMCAN